MNRCRKTRFLPAAVLTFLALHPAALRACSVCYGDPDSNTSRALGWGVAVLLGVVVTVLAGITTFFVYISKKSPTDKV
jgi:hypothetical protein